jgi:undecaprenyl-diphosphatase
MLFWAGIFFIAAGIGCVWVDRRAAHFFYDNLSLPFWRFLEKTTHWAKAGHWLIASILALIGGYLILERNPTNQAAELVINCGLAFIASLTFGSVILHSMKLVLGRRRPRDDIEMNLYGFIPFAFNLEHNSFPSGHALTIMCVAVIASGVWPDLSPLWFFLAFWLGLTRAMLSVHFLSDVFVGAGIGLIVTREVLVIFFPTLAPNWF